MARTCRGDRQFRDLYAHGLPAEDAVVAAACNNAHEAIGGFQRRRAAIGGKRERRDLGLDALCLGLVRRQPDHDDFRIESP